MTSGLAVVTVGIFSSCFAGISSASSRDLKRGSARSRRSAAMTRIAASSGSNDAISGRPARSASIAPSSCSMRFRSAMHFRAQFLQRSPLKLLDGSLAFPKLVGDVADTSLLQKTHHDHATLLRRKTVDVPRERRPLFGVRDFSRFDFVRRNISYAVFCLKKKTTKLAPMYANAIRQRTHVLVCRLTAHHSIDYML